MNTKTPHCKICDKEGHYAFKCPKRENKPMVSLKRLKQNGKHGYKWRSTKIKWYEQNLPDHAGYYYCYIGGEALTKEEVELDHVESRSRRPDLRYELSNIKPICHTHNTEKGSLSVEEYQAKLTLET